MLSTIITSCAGFLVFIGLDYLWLAKVAKEFYLKGLAGHAVVKDGALVPYLPAVPLVYAVAVLAIFVFVLSWVTDLKQAALYGAILGFCMYAFYDLTNLATLKEYPWTITVVDILWGTFVVGVVTTIMYLVKTNLS
jgi:uncharacterized membrane protein